MDLSKAKLAQASEGSIHVADDDREMLKPQVLTMTVGGILPAVFLEFNKLDLLRSHTHGERLEASAFDAEQMREAWVILALTPDGLEAERIAVELLGPGQVGNRYTDALDLEHRRRRAERQRQERNENGRERRTDAQRASSGPKRSWDV